MDPKKTDQPAPHAGESEKAAGQDRQSQRPAAVGDGSTHKDSHRSVSKRQGTLHDQVKTIESEGQAQPQADERPFEERFKGIPPLPEPDVEGVGEESGLAGDRNSDRLGPEQRKMADDGTGF